MKVTKRYLKVIIMCAVVLASAFTAVLAVIIGVAAVLGLITSGDLSKVLLLIAIAVVLGLAAALLYDLMEWLDRKFRPY